MGNKQKKLAMTLLGVVMMGLGAVSVQAQDIPSAAAPAVPVGPGGNGAKLGETKSMEGKDEKDLPYEIRLLRNIEKEIRSKKGAEIFERSSVPSLVFTPSQYALLREARVGFHTKSPSLSDLKNADPNDPNYRSPTVLRNIQLSGIAYNTPDDWTIWLNNGRVTPDNLPKQVIDLRVYKDFIELKWFDEQTNQLYPIRLRANQKFNLDSRVFLPG